MNANAPSLETVSAAAGSSALLRTLALCDLVDSTSLVERMGDQAAAELIRKHDRLARAIIHRHGGREIDKTDGFLILFERPIQAVAFAVEYQRNLLRLGVDQGQRLSARVGIHVGDVLVWENAPDDIAQGAKPIEVEGLVKPVAARLMSLARPGQILMSGVAQTLAQRGERELADVAERVRWQNHGRYHFKGVPEPMVVAEVGEVGIAPFKTPPSTEKAQREAPWWARPISIAVASLAMLLAIGVPGYLYLNAEPALAFAERDWVLVGDLDNLTGESLFDASLDTAFRIGLEQSRYVNVVPDLQVRDALIRMQREPGVKLDRVVGAELATREGARALILPSVAEIGGRVRVSAEVIDPRSGATVYSDFVDGKGAESALTSTDQLLKRLRGRLGESLNAIGTDSLPLERVTTKNLEALKAYSLGIRAFVGGDYANALQLLGRATELDPGFASAYAKIAGIHYVTNHRKDMLAAAAAAHAQKDRLALRERLYVEGILAFGGPPEILAQKWKLLASLFPDFFAGQHNYGMVVWQEQNRFTEALAPFQEVVAGRSPQRFLSAHMLGWSYLGLGDAAQSEKYFRLAISLAASPLSSGLADGLCYTRQYDQARQFLEKPLTSTFPLWVVYHRARWINFYADQGQISEALDQVRQGLHEAEGLRMAGGRQRLRLREIFLRERLDDENATKKLIAEVAREELTALEKPDELDYLPEQHALVLSMLASRHGLKPLARELLEAARPRVAGSQFFFRESYLNLAEAEAALAEGDSQTAIERLKRSLNGREPYATHEILARAYEATGDTARALAEWEWLLGHRGQAFAEWNYEFTTQLDNILTSNLAMLRVAERIRGDSPQRAATLVADFLSAWGQGDRDSLPRREADRLAAPPAEKPN